MSTDFGNRTRDEPDTAIVPAHDHVRSSIDTRCDPPSHPPRARGLASHTRTRRGTPRLDRARHRPPHRMRPGVRPLRHRHAYRPRPQRGPSREPPSGPHSAPHAHAQAPEAAPANGSHGCAAISRELPRPRGLAPGRRHRRPARLEHLIEAIITVESSGHHDARSPTGALGLMQLMPAHREEAPAPTAHRARHRQALPARPPMQQTTRRAPPPRPRRRLDRDLIAVLAAYNAGEPAPPHGVDATAIPIRSKPSTACRSSRPGATSHVSSPKPAGAPSASRTPPAAPTTISAQDDVPARPCPTDAHDTPPIATRPACDRRSVAPAEEGPWAGPVPFPPTRWGPHPIRTVREVTSPTGASSCARSAKPPPCGAPSDATRSSPRPTPRSTSSTPGSGSCSRSCP